MKRVSLRNVKLRIIETSIDPDDTDDVQTEESVNEIYNLNDADDQADFYRRLEFHGLLPKSAVWQDARMSNEKRRASVVGYGQGEAQEAYTGRYLTYQGIVSGTPDAVEFAIRVIRNGPADEAVDDDGASLYDQKPVGYLGNPRGRSARNNPPQRVTQKDLDRIVANVNRQLGLPESGYIPGKGEAPGAFSVSGAYGGWKIVQHAPGGGSRDVTSGYRPARETRDLFWAFVDGMRSARDGSIGR
jgi:hypothetical protein